MASLACMEHSESICERYLRQSPGCSWIIGGDFRFVRVNGDSVSIFNRPAQEVEGRTLSDALEAESSDVWRARMERVFAGETLTLREQRASITWYVVLFPIRDEKDKVNAAGFAFDATPWSTAERELRHTVLSALRAQEFERGAMSRFLHDSVGQNLSVAGLQLDLLRMDLESLSPEFGRRILDIQQMLETIMAAVREFSYELHPALVERAGLHAALDRLAGTIRRRFAGTVRLAADPSMKVPPRYAPAFYQIAVEAGENAVRHSACSVIEIAVQSTRMGPCLEIRDNGKGFDPATVGEGRRGLGILTMEHYAAQAGLDFAIYSTRESGTVIRAAASETGN